MRIIYPGSFDCLHDGHIDIINRASKMFDEVIVAVGVNETKTTIFSVDERIYMINKLIDNLTNVSVKKFNGLLSDFFWKEKADAVIRGARDIDDFKSIQQVNDILHTQEDDFETIILMSNYKNYSSGMIKAIEKHGGDISLFVSPYVKMKIEKKISNRFFLGITGTIGSGKNYISDLIKLRYKLYTVNTPVNIIDFDVITDHIHTKLTDPGYVNFRKELLNIFGEEIHDISDSKKIDKFFIDKRRLANIVFDNNHITKLYEFKNMMYRPVKQYLTENISKLTGIIILNCAYLIEYDLLDCCNGNVVIVDADKEVRKSRVLKRPYTNEDDFEKRCKFQGSLEDKIKSAEWWKESYDYGNV